MVFNLNTLNSDKKQGRDTDKTASLPFRLGLCLNKAARDCLTGVRLYAILNKKNVGRVYNAKRGFVNIQNSS